jgi:MFS family permease
MVAMGAWARPIAALGFGLLGDRFGISRMALMCFVLLIFSHSLFGFTGNAVGTLTLISLNTLVTCIAIFGLRGLYFGLLQEGQIPLAFTGTAVGLVSVLGYAPDIYIAAVAGFLIDRSPGLEGFQHLFILLLGVSIAGGIAAILFEREAKRAPGHPPV